LISIGTPIDGVDGGGFGVTRRDGTGGNLAIDKGGDRAEVVLSSAEEIECDMDWKASLVRYTWSILYTALYHTSESVLAGHLYDIVAIWFWMLSLRPRQNFTTSIQRSM